MRHLAIIVAAVFLVGSTLACCVMPEVPDIEINVPTIEVGEMQDDQETIPMAEAESATVEIFFGAGELELEAGSSGDLFSGHFRYNIEQLEPKVTYENDVLTIKQGSLDEDWGVPTGNVRNEWELEFSPEIPLEMQFEMGAGKGKLDFTGLQLTALDMDLGAGDFEVRFDEPNEVRMGKLTLDAGASELDVTEIGNASPEEVKVQGGVGDITLDFTGDWTSSADVWITAGIGAVTLRLPDDVGVRVETEGGLTDIDASGLQRQGDAYVNDAYGEAEIELLVEVTTGIGSLHLIEVPN